MAERQNGGGLLARFALAGEEALSQELVLRNLQAAGVACLLPAILALAGVTSHPAFAQENPPKAQPLQDETSVGPVAKPKQYPPITVTPHSANALPVFAKLGRKGLHVVTPHERQRSLRDPQLLIPSELRFKPVEGRQLIEAVASARGLKVAWARGGKYAVLHFGAADSEIERVRKDLGSNDVRVRNDAAWRGGWLRDARTVPLLVKAAKDPDAEVARQAFAGLRRMNWETVLVLDEGAAELLARELDCRDNMLRREASSALGLIAWEKALPLIEKALADDDDLVRHGAVHALGQIGDERALALLERTLADQKSRSWNAVLDALASIGGEKALALLEKSLGDQDRSLRRHAAEALGRVGGEKALALLESALADKDPFFRSGVVAALGHVGGEKALALLEKELADPSLEARRGAASALGSAGCAGGATGEKALALLENALTDHDAWVRSSVVWALAHTGGERALALLERALADADATVRISATEALGEIGGEKALALLEKALADPDGRVGGRAAYALGKIDGEKALALLERALASPDTLGKDHESYSRLGSGILANDVHQGAVSALKAVSWEKTPTLLEKALASPDDNLYGAGVAALGSIFSIGGGVSHIDAEEALRVLEIALSDPDIEVRDRAAFGLGLVGGEKALARLERILADPNLDVRGNANIPTRGMVHVVSVRGSVASALGRVGGERARELLEKELADKDAWVRYMAASGLGTIGGERARSSILAALQAEKTKWGRSHIREVVEKHFGDLLEVKEALRNLPPLPAEEPKPKPPPQKNQPDAGF